MTNTDVAKTWKDVPVAELKCDKRIIDALIAADFETADQVDAFEDLTQIAGIAESSAKVIKTAIETLKTDGFKTDDNGDSEDSASDSTSKPDTGVKSDPETPKPTGNQPAGHVDSESQSDAETDSFETEEEEARAIFLDQIKQRATEETEDGLYRMLAAANKIHDLQAKKVVNDELDRRHEERRKKQVAFELELRFSDLERTGYSTSMEHVNNFLHRTRLSHEASVALARLYVGMLENGTKRLNGRKIKSKSDVIIVVLEKAYAEMAKKINEAAQ